MSSIILLQVEHSSDLLSLHIEIPKKGIVQINRFATSPEDKEKILKAIKSVSGVSEVQCDIVMLCGV